MATFHMIPTQKAWDAVDKDGCLNNLIVSPYGILTPKTMSYKALDWLASDLATKQLDQMIEDTKRDSHE